MDYTQTYTEDDDVHRKAFVSSQILVWSSFWLVKASFLALMWSIFGVSRGFRIAWWSVTAYTFITYWPVILSELWICGTTSYLSGADCSIDVYYSTSVGPVIMRFILHLTSEIFILILPIAQIWKMDMRRSRKISVTVVFALVIVDILFGVLRNVTGVVLYTVGQDSDVSYDIHFVSDFLEPIIAVIVCSLPPYGSLVFRYRAKKNNHDFQRDAIPAKGGWHHPRKIFALLSANIPSPYFQISILDGRPTQTSETLSVSERLTTRKHRSIHLTDSDTATQTTTDTVQEV
ncbi:hypothetical protein MMC10_010903 [Thelotrema lepadinum]|nr:hypothetical protein [Thelotrema lepadinum]